MEDLMSTTETTEETTETVLGEGGISGETTVSS